MQLFLQIYFLLLTHNCAIAIDCLLDDCQIAGLLAQAGLLDCQIAMDCLWIARLVIGCIVHCALLPIVPSSHHHQERIAWIAGLLGTIAIPPGGRCIH